MVMQRTTAAVQGGGGKVHSRSFLKDRLPAAAFDFLNPPLMQGGGEGKRGEMVKFWEGEGLVARLPGGGIG